MHFRNVPEKQKLQAICTLVSWEESKCQRTLLHAATAHGALELVKALVEKLEDKNPQDKIGFTPLHCAARDGHLNIVKAIVPFLSDKNPKAGP